MEQSRQKSMSMVFVLVVSAIFCAVATFIAITLLSNRSRSPATAAPAPQQQIVVEGILITLDTDPSKEIVLASEAGSTIISESPELSQTAEALVPAPTEPPPPPTSPPPPPAVEPVIFINYTVQPSDSLYSIAQLQNSSIELMALHGIDGDDMVPGVALVLPIANSAYCPGSRAYVVRDHDTVFSIARAFNTTPEAIRSLNNLDENYTIKTTEVICVPTG